MINDRDRIVRWLARGTAIAALAVGAAWCYFVYRLKNG